jgi:hypothetical protein
VIGTQETTRVDPGEANGRLAQKSQYFSDFIKKSPEY